MDFSTLSHALTFIESRSDEEDKFRDILAVLDSPVPDGDSPRHPACKQDTLNVILFSLLSQWEQPFDHRNPLPAAHVLKYGRILLEAGASVEVKFHVEFHDEDDEEWEPLLIWLLKSNPCKSYADDLRLDFARMALQYAPDELVKQYSKSFRTCLVDKLLNFDTANDNSVPYKRVVNVTEATHAKIVEFVKVLIEKGAKEPNHGFHNITQKISVVYSQFFSWVHSAIRLSDRYPQYGLLDTILPHGRVNTLVRLPRPHRSSFYMITTLHYCVLQDDEELVRKLLAAGADPNVYDVNYVKKSPLDDASPTGGEVKTLLIAAGAKLGDQDELDENLSDSGSEESEFSDDDYL